MGYYDIEADRQKAYERQLRRAQALTGELFEPTFEELDLYFTGHMDKEHKNFHNMERWAFRLTDEQWHRHRDEAHDRQTARFNRDLAAALNGNGNGTDAEFIYLDMVPLKEFSREKPEPEFLVKGVVVANDLLAIGGPLKSLKTSISLDLAVSVGTGSPFLGEFPVPKVRRVGFLSGETGAYLLRENVIQICLDRGVTYSDNETIFICTKLPDISRPGHRDYLSHLIKHNGLDLLIVDPLYLCIPSGNMNGGINTSNMFEMGAILKAFAETCQEAGCTPAFNHHFPKTRAEPYAMPELNELAYGGVSQVMGQWILLARRERFDPTSGIHKLHLLFGGRFGHAGEFAIDINTGIVNGDLKGRTWDVTVSKPADLRTAESERKTAAQEEKKNQKEREDMATIAAIFRDNPGATLNVKNLRMKTNWGTDRVERACYLLVDSRFLREGFFPFPTSNHASRECRGYQENV